MRMSLHTVACCITACIALSVFTGANAAVLQDGRRFPMGIQLGSDVNCTSSEDDGLLRLNGEQVEMCQELQWISVSSNETRQLNSELTTLRDRVDQLEDDLSTCSSQNHSGASSCNLGNLEALTAIQMCNLHGVYNAVERQCDCDCDARLGCWNATDFCSTCASGWTGQYCLGDVEDPSITIIGDELLTHEAGNPYIDSGATAFDNKDLDITDRITVANSVVSDTVGTYTVVYSVYDNAGNDQTAVRTVDVVDTTPPVITLSGPAVVTLEAGDSFVEPGFTASDNAVGALNVQTNLGSISLVTVGEHTLVYTLQDEAGNVAANQQRTIAIVDTTPPVLTLLGENPVYHGAGITYVDAGVSSTDNSDSSVEISSVSNVDVNTVGVYNYTYSAVDEDNNEAVEVTREVRVIDFESCDEYQLDSSTELADGVYTVIRGGSASTRFCHFEGGRGYDLAMNLVTDDTVSRHYDDTTFWLGTDAIGSVSASTLASEYKNGAWYDLDFLQEVLIVYHDGSGQIAATARYPILCSKSGSGTTLHTLMNLANDQVVSGVRIGNPSSMSYHSGTIDPFTQRYEPLMFNSQSAFSASQNLNRMLTTYRSAPWTGHVTGGIGGHHYHSGSGGWGMRYEFNPVEVYCDMNDLFGSSSSVGGNYVSVGYPRYNLEPACLSSPTWHGLNIAIFALGGTPTTAVPPSLQSLAHMESCDTYIDANPGTPSGPVTFSDGRISYCHFENGVGYDLLFNLDTGDSVVRHYHDEAFWYATGYTGSITSSTLSAEFIGDAYSHAIGWSEVMIMVHDEGNTVYGTALYDVSCSVSRQSLRNMMTIGSQRTITGSKKNANGNLNLAASSSSIDYFIEDNSPLVINRQSAYSASRNLNRLATTHTSWDWTGHVYGGVGGDHYHSGSSGWGYYYEYTNAEVYCGMENQYGTASGNYQCGTATNCPTQGNCAPSASVHPYDFAFFVRIPAISTSNLCDAC